MINTLRITGVIAVLLAGVLFVFPVLFGVRSDEQVNEFLGSPGARERFEQAADSKAQDKEDRASPLVQQAEAFALYLNPPKSSIAGVKDPKGAGLRPYLPTASPKFKVFATSYFENDPELSLALIDEPGRGRRWVRQSSTVGHLVIDQVKDGVVVVKSDGQTYELPVELIPETAAASTPSAASTLPAPRDLPSRSGSVPSALSRTPALARALPQRSGDTEKEAKLQDLARQLIDVQRNAATGGAALSDDEKRERTYELIAQYRAAQRSVRVSPQEAKELGNLGKIDLAQEEPSASGRADNGSEPE